MEQEQKRCCAQWNGAGYHENGVLICRYCRKPMVPETNPRPVVESRSHPPPTVFGFGVTKGRFP